MLQRGEERFRDFGLASSIVGAVDVHFVVGGAQWMGLDNTRFVAICNLAMEEILGNMWYSHLTWRAE